MQLRDARRELRPAIDLAVSTRLRSEANVEVPDGPSLPESWAHAYRLLRGADEPPVLVSVIDAVAAAGWDTPTMETIATDVEDSRDVDDALRQLCDMLTEAADACDARLTADALEYLRLPFSVASTDRLRLARSVAQIEPVVASELEYCADEGVGSFAVGTGARLPGPWARAYAVLDALDDPPAIVAALESVEV